MHLYPQLNFGGNCEEAFRFYETHLGGRITAMMRRSQVPGAPAPTGDGDDPVIHARMDLAGTELLANDVPRDVYQPMRSVYLHLVVDSVAEAERTYALLSDGGEVFMPLGENFFATRFAMLRDRFGVSWALLLDRPRP